MKLVVGAVLTYDLNRMDIQPGYDPDEIVELLRLDLQRQYEEYDLEVQVTDYYGEIDENEIGE